MKKTVFLICFTLALFLSLQENALSQVPAHYKYEYDQAGNRTSSFSAKSNCSLKMLPS